MDTLDEWIPRLEPLTTDELVKRMGALAADPGLAVGDELLGIVVVLSRRLDRDPDRAATLAWLDRLLLLIDDGSEARGIVWELCRSLEKIYEGTQWIAALFRNLAPMMAKARETTETLHLRAINDDALYGNYLAAVRGLSRVQKEALEVLLAKSDLPDIFGAFALRDPARVQRVRAFCRE